MAYAPTPISKARTTSESTPGVFIYDDSNPRVAVVFVFGETTFADTAEFESIIVGAIRIGRPVVIDMSECTYLDCAAIGVLVRAAKNLRDYLHLVVPRHSQGFRMLDITGLARVLQIHETLEAATTPAATKPVATLRGV